jgi:hypothetical protein
MDLGPEFQVKPGATEELVERTLFELGRALPEEYCEVMGRFNGGEGFVNGHYLVLWPLEELAAANRAFEDIEDVRDVVWFGGNGGGEAFGFDWRQDGAIVEGPMIGMERDQLMHCAGSFTEFLRKPTGFKDDK